MDGPDFAVLLGPALAGALKDKGFTSLTSVQSAVLDPELAGRDLRITSQTGSGKTIAIGFALRELVQDKASSVKGIARPRALVVAPTRELAKQDEHELSWLYAALSVNVASVTGGADYRLERRALAASPALVVGTPGRLLDHLKRGSIDTSELAAIVLDEADRMLDMGFREELEAILGFAPEEHQTHLVSATFPREVRALADRVQHHAAHVEGSRLGEANADIDHVVHVVDPSQRVDAIVNLLLAHPDDQTLIFARTRVEVGEIATELGREGFAVGSLSGQMEQAARDRALAAFRSGEIRALVATDVAARGIDVISIARVIHAEPPTDADTYTHRSGRTGRAGNKGTSCVLVSPIMLRRTLQMLQVAGVESHLEPVPSADAIAAAADERLFAELTADYAPGFPGYDKRIWTLAKRLVEAGETARVFARLLTRGKSVGVTPRQVRVIDLSKRTEGRGASRATGARDGSRYGARDGSRFGARDGARDGSRFGGSDAPRDSNAPPPRAFSRQRVDQDAWVPFRVSWGSLHGADPRRLLAMVCRRGGIHGNEVGSIRVEATFSVLEVQQQVAKAFAEAVSKPDPRNPRVLISPDRGPSRRPPARERRSPRASAD